MAFSFRRATRIIVAASIALVPVAVLSSTAEAASYTVTKTSDDGSSGTLRWAITQANSSAGADTIDFANGVTGTITLTSDLPSITDDLTITGPGEANLTIDGDSSYRPFTIRTGGKFLTISHLSLTKGTGVGFGPNQGSLLWNEYATVSATNVTFKNDPGVAVFNLHGTTMSTYTNCTFKDGYIGISSDHGNTPTALSNTESDYQNRTYVVNSTFLRNTYGILAERFTKVTGSTFTDNTWGALIRGLNRSQVLNSTFSGHQFAIAHSNYTPVAWTSVGTNNRFIDGNTFTNNSTAMYLADNWDNGRATQRWATVTNNSWDGSGNWIMANYWNSPTSNNQTQYVTTVNSAGREWIESGNIDYRSTTTTTTSTIPPSTTTTVAPANNTTTTIAGGAGSIVSGSNTGTSTTIAKDSSRSLVAAPATTSPIATTTTSTIPVPDAPDVSTGEAIVTVDGETTQATISRENNSLVVDGGGINASIYGLATDGARIDLDNNGNLQLSDQDQIGVNTEGFAPDADIEVWMFSTPTQLGTLTTDISGKAAGSFSLPAGIEAGDHRVVLKGANNKGQDVVVGVGVRYGKIDSGSMWGRLLIAIPVALAVIFGLIIPTTLKRRRDEQAASTTA